MFSLNDDSSFHSEKLEKNSKKLKAIKIGGWLRLIEFSFEWESSLTRKKTRI